MRYYPMFPWAIPHPGTDHLRVTHPFATLPHSEERVPVRLACLRRAASVSSEPGSNSPSYYTSLPHLRREASLHMSSLDPGAIANAIALCSSDLGSELPSRTAPGKIRLQPKWNSRFPPNSKKPCNVILKHEISSKILLHHIKNTTWAGSVPLKSRKHD